MVIDHKQGILEMLIKEVLAQGVGLVHLNYFITEAFEEAGYDCDS